MRDHYSGATALCSSGPDASDPEEGRPRADTRGTGSRVRPQPLDQLASEAGDGVTLQELPPAAAIHRSDIRQLRGDEPRAQIGRVIAERYELRRLLGEGGAGAVYEARVLERGDLVAVKLMHKHLRTSDAHAARFRREVRALARVAHSAVVRVLDAGEDTARTLYLVMELLDGDLLQDRIERGLETREVIEVGRQLLGALAAAHGAGIVHRDIKPENLVVMRSTSGGLRLKVLDFGIAKLARPDPSSVSFQTMDGLILGTPEYMSPEVCRGALVTEADDLWAVAAVLFHAFMGRPPFEDTHVGKLLLRIVREPAPRLSELRPELPAPITAAIDRALHPSPEQRFSSARDFASALSSAAPIDELDWD